MTISYFLEVILATALGACIGSTIGFILYHKITAKKGIKRYYQPRSNINNGH